jgi:hypothetical protein
MQSPQFTAASESHQENTLVGTLYYDKLIIRTDRPLPITRSALRRQSFVDSAPKLWGR